MILNRLFNPQVSLSGFYVDVGAHHPERFSNTYLFYKLGWRGINIDAMPDSMVSFKKYRPLDINLEFAIAKNSGEKLVYYRFNEPALNGFSKELTEKRQKEPNSYYVVDEIKLKTYKLSDVLENYVPEDVEIDFLTIDAEGMDYEILQSNDWEKFRPKIILVEILNNSFEDYKSDDIYIYLKDKNYELYAKTINTIFFRRNDFDL